MEKKGGYNGATWQYWVDDGVDGKKNGWYDYDTTGSRNVEQLYQENLHNPMLTTRLVDSGCWTYNVDLLAMKQTNVKHPNRTSRFIRRYTGEEMNDDAPPATEITAPITLSTPAMVTPTATPITTVSSAKAVTSSSAVKSLAAKFQAASEEQTPPVDSDINICGRAPHSSNLKVMKNEDNEWYDVVLNQCNITGGNNNNKYYRLQMLEEQSTGNIYVWFKWGRVGESPKQNTIKCEGPFSQEAAALKVFAKKYKDKTKNNWGDENFVPKKGKYTRIEIDYTVNATNVKSEPKSSKSSKEDIEYLESKLDPKTKELIEVLFSKEMRDEALTSFNLDLKRLPLGVPSQQQIQNGISVLNKIEDKLSGTRMSESYDSLSSQFYTAIPHSFGRMRPPTINTQSSLQGRYDMCNILLDMFSTNETIREIEEKKPKKQMPCPTDSHYDTLKADLSLVDSKSDEFKMVQKYFNKTKHSCSSSKLIDVWSVDRQGEAERFEKYEKMENRRLLWHGTNIAVVAPIITSGLRIMPHSGGRVGSGIYLASMQEKSAGYTSGYGAKFACMFLCEGALGKTHKVTSDGPHASGLKKAPTGFDSVHAVGQVTPKAWSETRINEKAVDVPNDKAHQSGVQSSFYHDEYLVYDESQVRLRYVLTVKL